MVVHAMPPCEDLTKLMVGRNGFVAVPIDRVFYSQQLLSKNRLRFVSVLCLFFKGFSFYYFNQIFQTGIQVSSQISKLIVLSNIPPRLCVHLGSFSLFTMTLHANSCMPFQPRNCQLLQSHIFNPERHVQDAQQRKRTQIRVHLAWSVLHRSSNELQHKCL